MRTRDRRSITRFFGPLRPIIGWFLVAGIPLWMLLGSTRLLMTEAYLHFEYTRSDFPADPYGFTQDERQEYARYAIDYLQGDQDITYLAELTLPDGHAMYNRRELRHMADVKTVTQTALAIHNALTVILAGAIVWLSRQPGTRRLLRKSLACGGYVTIGLILALVIIIALNWDLFFDGFHQLFFESGTWRFEYSDTLIRLFPERFWFDAAMAIGLLTVTGEALLIGAAWLWERQTKAAASYDTAAAESEPESEPE